MAFAPLTATKTYPATLPQVPLIPGGSSAPHQAPNTTEMEDGPARSRRSARSTWTEISFAYLMTAAQWQIWTAFERDDLAHGSARFNMPVWRPGALRPLPQKLVRINGGQSSWRPSGAMVLVTIPLLVLDY